MTPETPSLFPPPADPPARRRRTWQRPTRRRATAPRDPNVEYREPDWMPGYCVGSDGSVWSRRVRGGLPSKRFGVLEDVAAWREMKQQLPWQHQEKPYFQVMLRLPPPSPPHGKVIKVHQIVCRAFHGPRPFPGAIVLHGDGDERNNTPANLRWGTHAENQADSYRHGVRRRLITHADLVELFSLRQNGVPLVEIARRFAVSVRTIHSALKRGKAIGVAQGVMLAPGPGEEPGTLRPRRAPYRHPQTPAERRANLDHVHSDPALAALPARAVARLARVSRRTVCRYRAALSPSVPATSLVATGVGPR